ncbi:acyl-CoA/acyl-ACP dehydrogenase [Sulfitobacter pseudonitzschiae]|jgi:alkylation response protein AidB-like acyl-CoA dehydrogenase|uniref:Acyl-CoA dehydrogenase n=1 Tax=Pseudosulfitobacter pseudonitzschiae TaxID=1402135 RepID=A0A073J9K2_9RHOB|nr:acyl-CoA dehydrogenase family protein [Pseudosulfitobacter pseudonitzschiae]MBA98489.1 acyl-CoA dehydrogenase [Roseobacter sp.]KEJ94407.1 acyl-CoA dehydrogenase [Pseudosulfitobacter pseudonitzschiae]MBM1816909.1 acyl-CoA/acyl-ACP dehydrogenase [Pseudosulfitobacter pseudonitzschiae]MBM1833922.1 acyl-CoA/acyl-ACP dehydrogenase [Pseudosulfitobacter pseudonitzschiae]MBM1838788.1 acyl-CoA/acyl-ACP dehydrogenase [Pseudosulfitobacter pseudonitzschiae]
MNFGFSEEQDTIRETLARMLGDHATLKSAHNRLDGADGFDTATWSVLADGGWLGLAISEAEGGAGMGAVELAILAEEIGRSLAAVPYLPALCMAVPALQSAGTQDQRTSLLPGIAKGRTIIATALAEGGGLAPDTVSAKVVQDRLSGQKAPVTFGAEATHALVAATDEEGTPRLYLADLSGSGVTIGALDPIDRTRPAARIDFDNAPVELLPGSDPAAIRRLLDGAAVLAAFEQIGLAERALALTTDYAGERHAFGRAIGGFQAVKHRLADMFAKIELARSNAFFGAWALASGDSRLPEAAAVARLTALDAVQFATEESIQLHGGIGFTWAADPHLFLRRGWQLKAELGTAAIWRERLLGHLATPLRAAS